jgi:4-amino-4-deoxy-L-arabinose transferase-like glycosyltransferase
VALAAAVFFRAGVADEDVFVDEMALYSQSYFADLLVQGDRDNRAWLEYPGFDSSPLPKYLIGLALRYGGYRTPDQTAWRQWFRDTKTRFDPPGALELVRWPFVVGGALGCVAIYALGVLARDVRTGLLAAVLLIINPLYRLHARRAMADVLVEAFLLVCLALMLWVWKRTLAGRGGPANVIAAILAGVAAGLSPLAKLNGGLTLVIIVAWTLFTLGLPRFPLGRRLAFARAALVSAIVAVLTFVALNPFLTAQPTGPLPPHVAAIAGRGFWARVRMLVVQRVEVSRSQVVNFPHNALTGPRDKIAVAAVQGFGRFGPFGPRHSDSERRYDWVQDWGAPLWLPWVGAGFVWALVHGRRQYLSGEPPTAWAIALQAVVAAAVVVAYLPMAWDRYLLPLQAGSALLAAAVAVAAVDRLGRAMFHRQQPRGGA